MMRRAIGHSYRVAPYAGMPMGLWLVLEVI